MKINPISEAARLYRLGFGILALKPKSKQPIESKWTTGPRQPLTHVLKLVGRDSNIGTRLGEASKLGDHYLACIDVDVKDPSALDEALEKLEDLIGTHAAYPEVKSGGGHGSRHLYFVSPAPFKMITFAKSKGRFEICIYSTGRQMVLPPSIHPDTGQKYVWTIPPSSIGDFPLKDFSRLNTPELVPTHKNSEPPAAADFTFKVEDIDIDWVPGIGPELSHAIKTGEGVQDRSAYLLSATKRLSRLGLTQNEVLSVLTSPHYALGKCAYDHAKTQNRAMAAAWLYRYTFKKAEADSPLSLLNAVAYAEPRKLSVVERGEQDAEIEALSYPDTTPRFYSRGARGALTPQYDKLLEEFESTHPYKTLSGVGTVYVYGGSFYAPLEEEFIRQFAETNMWPRPMERVRQEFLSKVLANNVITREFFTKTSEGKVNFLNGVLDLNVEAWAQELHPPSPSYGFRGVLPFAYDPEAKCPFFEKWLDDLMLSDKDLVKILQEYMGYIIRGGDYKYHKALWLGGSGRNGKSTFIDVVKALVGSENYSTASIGSLLTDKFTAAVLEGKLANISEETSPHELTDSSKFKNVTGDGDVPAQKKFVDVYHFRNRAKLIMTYNQIPELKDLSEGMRGRPLIIPFLRTFTDAEQDHGIKKKLFAELPGIFNFALQGWYRLESQDKFTESAASKAAMKAVCDESCNVHQWAAYNVEWLEPGHPEYAREWRPADLYSMYKKSEKFSYAQNKFYKRLNAIKEVKNRVRHTNRGNIYRGIKVVSV